jgi:chorismate mutase
MKGDLMFHNIDRLRERKKGIDKRISRLLDSRAEIAKNIGIEKRKNNIKIINKAKEREIIRMVTNKSKNKTFVKKCFESIIKESRKIQRL